MSDILNVILYWQNWFADNKERFIERQGYETKDAPNLDLATAYIGVRRCGKTYIACNIARKLSTKILYINFEDPFFFTNKEVSILDLLLENYTEHYGYEPEFIVFDEIQYIKAWERWLRKYIDSKKYRIIITGSSATLLSSELSSSLTGRALEKKVFPLSYKEFLAFTQSAQKLTNNEHLAKLKQYFDLGGFPAVVLEADKYRQGETLQQYFTDIIYKDIVSRYEIRNVGFLEQLIQFYLTNVSSTHTFSSIKKAFNVNIETVQDYSSYCQNAFLLFFVTKYDSNLKVQARSPKKVYAIDSGLRNSQSLSKDYGKVAENIIFLELKRRGKTIYYHKGEYELDFLIVDKHKVTEAIQVSYSNLEDTRTYERELNGALEACLQYKLDTATIITKNRHEIIKQQGKKIILKPLFEYLLAN